MSRGGNAEADAFCGDGATFDEDTVGRSEEGKEGEEEGSDARVWTRESDIDAGEDTEESVGASARRGVTVAAGFGMYDGGGRVT